MEVISIEEVKRVNREHGKFYFSVGTMRFFKSRVSKQAYKVGNKAYFITSERGPHMARKWSIRVADLTTGKIDTVGEFQEFNTNREAKKELERICKV